MNVINHLSGSSLRSFDNYRDQWFDNYILGRRQPDNVNFEFGRQYEAGVKQLYNNVEYETKLVEYVEGYKILGYKDMENKKAIREIKTKSGWWSKGLIRKDWQFRIYNHFRGEKEFIIDQRNKKREKYRIDNIGRHDPDFISDFLEKVAEIEQYIEPYGFTIKKY